jgi:putative Mg2+ transporter-C (MgtC) family protein
LRDLDAMDGTDVVHLLTEVAWNALNLAIAFVVVLPVAWDREKAEQTAGLRTIPLVSMASCAFVLVARSVLSSDTDAESRVLQGLIAGIGFLGGGAIIKHERSVRGTATAAAIWAAAIIGAAVAYRRFEIAIALAVAVFGTLRWLERFKNRLGEDQR